MLERISAADPQVRVVDTRPLSPGDPNGVDIFYLMLVSTIVGFITVFQVGANAGGLPLRQWPGPVAALAAGAGLILALVDAGLHRHHIPVLETWASSRSRSRRWRRSPLCPRSWSGAGRSCRRGCSSSCSATAPPGGAVAPPLLPRPFAVISQRLPSGATVEALRSAIYFGGCQHVQPVAVPAGRAAALFAAEIGVSHRLGTSPGGTPSGVSNLRN